MAIVATVRALSRRLPRPRRGDALLAGVVCVATILSVIETPLGAHPRPADVVGIVAALGMTLPLAWRRRWPLRTLALVMAMSTLSNLNDSATDPAELFTWFAFGSCAYYSSRRTSVVLGAFATGFELFWWKTWDGPDFGANDITLSIAVGIVPILLGDLLRVHHEQAEALRARDRRMHELESSHAAESERLRIARELHDIVGHHLSAIGVQARATGLLVHEQPDLAVGQLRALGAMASTALTETRQSVAALRDGATLEPQPDLDRIDDLVRRARADGLTVGYQRRGSSAQVLESLQLCGYRIVQEALTNAVRHAARPARVDVDVAVGARELVIDVVSRGTTPASQTTIIEGFGLAGMRERAQLAGGRIDAGPDGRGAWAVRASLPTRLVTS